MTNPVFGRTSVFLPFPSGMEWDEYLDYVRLLDRSGIDVVWTNETIDHDPFSILAVCAAATTRIDVGTSIATWARSAPTLAAAAATVDRISGGRFRLGLGTMPREWNRDWHGIPPERFVRRMREYVEVLRLIWTAHSGRVVNYDGEIVQLRNFTLARPPLRERIPIYLGVSGPQLMHLAGRIADGVLHHSCYTMQTLHEVTLPMLERGAREAGRCLAEIDLSLTVSCCISDDVNLALRVARTQVAWYSIFDYNAWVFEHHGWGRQRQAAAEAWLAGDREAALAAVSDEMALAVCLAGTPGQVRDQARRKFGDLDFLARLGTPTEAPPDFKRQSMLQIPQAFGTLQETPGQG